MKMTTTVVQGPMRHREVKRKKPVMNGGIDQALGEGEKLITTVLLNGERLHVKVHTNAITKEVFDHVTRYIGLNEIQYFGLMIIKDGEHQFLDLEEKLSKLAKYAPHLWKDDSSWNSSLVFTLFFRVKYYVENICLLEEQATRHQYYLQLRKDVLENNIRIHDDTAMVLASYALQAELGDYEKATFGTDYFVPQHYLPAKTIAKLTVPYIKSALPAMHQSHRGLTEPQAAIEFLKEAQKLSEYGILFYRVFRKEYNRKIPYTLGVCVRGLIIYEDTGTVRNPFCKHPWGKIKKMSFKRRKFLINAESLNAAQGHIVLYTANYKRSRYLLKTCSAFYNFQMRMADKMAKFHDYFEPPRVQPNNIPTVRIDPDGMPDVQEGRRMSLDREQNDRRKPAPSKDHAKEQPKQKPKPQAKQYTVDLIKIENSFGFSIVGGIELGGIFVKELTAGGPAALSGQISAGDRIVQVNKVNFENVTRREAINTLRNASDRSKFTFETFGQTMLLEADPSILTPLTLSASSIATLGNNNVPPLSGERESELVRVELPKKDGNFGIGFTGGPELGGIYIKSFLPGGSAETNGRIAIGDRLVEIGNTNVESFTRKQVQDMLRTSSSVVTLVLERFKKIPMNDVVHYIDPERVLRSNPNFLSVTLVKKQESLGFSITGGHELGGIFIKSLNMNGPAAMDGRLEVGDRIVAINNVSLETATRPKALDVIRTAVSPVRLILEKCVPPENNPHGQPGESGIHRSDSIKSLPTGYSKNQRIPNNTARGLALSMQDITGMTMNNNNNHSFDYGYDMSDSRQIRKPQQQQQQQQQVKPQQQQQQFQQQQQQRRPDVSQSTGSINRRQSMAAEVFVVDLPRINGSFGLGLTGGPEVAGIFVKALQAGGAAGQDGRIQKGDRLVEINGRRMDGFSKHDAVEMLKSSGGMATLIFERYGYHQPRQTSSQMSSFDGECVAVELFKKNGTFGLCISNGTDLGGLHVKNVLPGGSSDGKVCKGDRIIEINGIPTDGFSKSQCDEVLRKTPHNIVLMIERVRNAEDVPAMDEDLFNVELRRGEGGLGITLTGGIDIGGIYIKGIMPESQAEQCDRIARGDRVVEINGVCLDGLSKHQAGDLLKRANVISLLLERNAVFDNMVIPESDFFTVDLIKKNNSFGLNLAGGPEIDGIYVKSIQSGGSAADDGRMQKGDRIVAINGNIIDGMTRQQAYEKLKGSVNKVILYLERCTVGSDVPPLDTVLTVVELTKVAGSFGLSLTGGPESGGIFVRAMMPGGTAEIDGRVQLGDKVTEINGISLEGCSKLRAIEILKSSPQTATFILERYKTSPRRLSQRAGGSQLSSRSLSSGALAFNLSQQNLSQSRTSVQSLGALDSQSNQSGQNSQLPAYCTLPRQNHGQNQPSAFHPVTSKGASGTPRTIRNDSQFDSNMQFSQRADLQVNGREIPGKTQFRSLSQPSSPTRGFERNRSGSIYNVKSNKVADASTPVRVLQTGSGTSTPATTMSTYSTTTPQVVPAKRPVQTTGPRSANTTPTKQAGLQWIPLGDNSPKNSDQDRGSQSERGFSSERSFSSERGTSSTVHTGLSEVKSDSIYSAGQVPAGLQAQTLPRTLRTTREGMTSSYGSSTSIYATVSKAGNSSLTPLTSNFGSHSMQELSHNQTSPRSGGMLPKASSLAMNPVDRIKSSIYGQSSDQSQKPTVTSDVAKTTSASVYSINHRKLSNPGSERGKPNDFASLHSSIYAATQSKSGLSSVGSRDVIGQNSSEVSGRSSMNQNTYSQSQSVYSNNRSTASNPLSQNTMSQDTMGQSPMRQTAGQAGMGQGSLGQGGVVQMGLGQIALGQTAVMNNDVRMAREQTQKLQGERSQITSSMSKPLWRSTSTDTPLSVRTGDGMHTNVPNQSSRNTQGLLSMSQQHKPQGPVQTNVPGQPNRGTQGVSSISQSIPQRTNAGRPNENNVPNQTNRSAQGISQHMPQGTNAGSIPQRTNEGYSNVPNQSNRGAQVSQQHRQQGNNDNVAHTTWSDQRMKQYPPPPVGADYNQNEVPARHNGSGSKVYENAPPQPSVKKGTSGFSPFSNDHIFEVVLYKGPVGLGMSLYGGGNEGPVRIKKVAKGSSADDCGQLQPGDFLLEVNGIAVERLSSREVVGLLRSSPHEILLLVKRINTVDPNYYPTSSPYIGL